MSSVTITHERTRTMPEYEDAPAGELMTGTRDARAGGLGGDSCPWIEEVSEQLDRMAALPVNWDGAGSAAPRVDVIASAKGFLGALREAGVDVIEPYVTPTVNGGVMLQWERQERELEIEFIGPGAAEFSYLDHGTDEHLGAEIFIDDRGPEWRWMERLVSIMADLFSR